MSQKFWSLIMAGGRGTRLWPASTSERPKQYLPLGSGKALIAETLSRFDEFIPVDNRAIVTVEDQKVVAMEATGEALPPENIILEPAGRNTAPCLFLSLLWLLNKGVHENSVLGFFPADHVITDHKKFRDSLKLAYDRAAESEKIVIVGIPPTAPHTGFGYIEKNPELASSYSYRVESFREKPDFETATKYLKSGNFLWNAGIFVGKLGLLLEQFRELCPDIYRIREELQQSLNDPTALNEAYDKLPEISFDYAILEKSRILEVVPAKFDWNDLGSWNAFAEVTEAVDENHSVMGKRLETIDSRGNIVYAPEKNVALVGVEDLVIVSVDDKILVMRKEDSQRVKEIAKRF